VHWVIRSVFSQGTPNGEHIEAPGTLDGGDVLEHGGTVWVGLGGRTNEAGMAQLAALLARWEPRSWAYRSPACCT
jgi:N-dimethylarginine dimethylaminohydrolase